MTDLELELSLHVESGATIALPEDRITDLTRFVLKENGKSGKWSISVVLTSDDFLQRLHRNFMGIDSPTDVMTFPAEPVAGESDAGGDVVISVERAEEQGAEHGHSKEEEIEFLIVHGLLHLCGWDDHDDAERARMLDFQTKLIGAFNTRQDANA
jgi:probable rRNA maturation factor